MERDSIRSAHFSKVAIRALAAVVGVGLFLAVASVIDPGSSTATLDPFEVRPDGTTAAEDPGPSLGELQGLKYRVEIISGENGPLYDVYDAQEGVLLLDRARADEVQAEFPELNLENLLASPMSDVDPFDPLKY